ncbi:MAG TPA: hypothetical protein VHO90_22605 [Bacteroidales bacterium]|nr:hypothetical protein [Bacteroidales bacterium]
MYSYESYWHIIILLILIGVVFMIYRYFTEKHKEDENRPHPDY